MLSECKKQLSEYQKIKEALKLLGLSGNAKLIEIKTTCSKLTMKYSLNNLKTGNRQKFEEIQNAYELLSAQIEPNKNVIVNLDRKTRI